MTEVFVGLWTAITVNLCVLSIIMTLVVRRQKQAAAKNAFCVKTNSPHNTRSSILNSAKLSPYQEKMCHKEDA